MGNKIGSYDLGNEKDTLGPTNGQSDGVQAIAVVNKRLVKRSTVKRKKVFSMGAGQLQWEGDEDDVIKASACRNITTVTQP